MSIVNREKFLVYCGIFLVCAGLPSAWIISETEKETAFFLSAVLMITGIALGHKFGQHGKAAKMPDMPGSILGDMSLFHVKTLKKKLEDDLHIYHYDDDNYPSSDELAAMRTTKP